MKKIVALVLSLVMVLGLATVAFANDYAPTATYYTAQTAGATDEVAYYAESDYVVGGLNWLAHIVDGGDNYYTVGGTTKLWETGLKAADGTMGKKAVAEDFFYAYQAKVFGEQKWSCTTDGVKADYTYVDENGLTCYADKDAEGELFLLVNGKVVAATPVTDIIKAGHCLVVKTGVGPVELDYGVYQAYCITCKKDLKISEDNANAAGYLYDTAWEDVLTAANKTYAIPSGYEALDGTWYVIGTAAPVVDADKVESAQTFDAGIAMYVGMSVMAAAGSAVVLKKKD